MSTHSIHIGETEVDVPSTFNTYSLIRQIGVGGFSAVCLVRHRITNAELACKIVMRNSLTDPHSFARLEQEVRLLEQIHHPNIVHVIDVIFQDAFIFVLMEYCSGGELFTYLAENGRLREDECQRVFADIVSAISYLHARGISHRDLKPENILLDGRMVPKVADFGLCHFCLGHKLTATPCGSPIYAAPEVVSGHPYDGKMCDIWSLGVMLYVMATARPPWESTSPVQLMKEVSSGEFRIPGYISAELKSMMRSMMRVTPGSDRR
jgi:serine/threonine protein kinase